MGCKKDNSKRGRKYEVIENWERHAGNYKKIKRDIEEMKWKTLAKTWKNSFKKVTKGAEKIRRVISKKSALNSKKIF